VWFVGFGAENVVQDSAFLRGELALELVRRHHGFTLLWGILAQIAKGLFDHALPVRW
jgi:hypothetical protein